MSAEHGPTSDSENEDPEDNKNCSLQLGEWLTFKADAEVFTALSHIFRL